MTPALILALLPQPQGGFRLVSSRDIRAGRLHAEYSRVHGAAWHLEADLRNALIADAASIPEAFELMARFASQQAGYRVHPQQEAVLLPPHHHEEWVRLIVPDAPPVKEPVP